MASAKFRLVSFSATLDTIPIILSHDVILASNEVSVETLDKLSRSEK